MVGWQARKSGARWQSAVEDYCTKCGGNGDDIRVVIRSIAKAVESDRPPAFGGVLPEREVIYVRN